MAHVLEVRPGALSAAHVHQHQVIACAADLDIQAVLIG